MHTLGLLFVTPYRNYFSADENYFLADGIFISPDVIAIIMSVPSDCESEGDVL